MYVIRSPDSAGAFSNQSDFTGKWPQVSLMALSIFVWLPIISAGTGFLSSAGARVVRESSKTVSLVPLLVIIIIIIIIIIIYYYVKATWPFHLKMLLPGPRGVLQRSVSERSWSETQRHETTQWASAGTSPTRASVPWQFQQHWKSGSRGSWNGLGTQRDGAEG